MSAGITSGHHSALLNTKLGLALCPPCPWKTNKVVMRQHPTDMGWCDPGFTPALCSSFLSHFLLEKAQVETSELVPRSCLSLFCLQVEASPLALPSEDTHSSVAPASPLSLWQLTISHSAAKCMRNLEHLKDLLKEEIIAIFFFFWNKVKAHLTSQGHLPSKFTQPQAAGDSGEGELILSPCSRCYKALYQRPNILLTANPSRHSWNLILNSIPVNLILVSNNKAN